MDIFVFVPYAVSIIIGVSGTYFLIFKKKLGEFRKLIDSIDDAIYDDSINEEEFRKIYENAKKLLER